MSSTTFTTIRDLILNPPGSTILPTLPPIMRARKTLLKTLISTHKTARQNRSLFLTGNVVNKTGSSEAVLQTRAQHVIPIYESLIALHEKQLRTMDDTYRTFYQHLVDGVRCYARPEALRSESDVLFIRDAKVCLDELEYGMWEWSEKVVEKMEGFGKGVGVSWKEATMMLQPGVLGTDPAIGAYVTKLKVGSERLVEWRRSLWKIDRGSITVNFCWGPPGIAKMAYNYFAQPGGYPNPPPPYLPPPVFLQPPQTIPSPQPTYTYAAPHGYAVAPPPQGYQMPSAPTYPPPSPAYQTLPQSNIPVSVLPQAAIQQQAAADEPHVLVPKQTWREDWNERKRLAGERDMLTLSNEMLKEQKRELLEQTEKLKKKMKELREKNGQLQEKNDELREEKDESQEQIAALTNFQYWWTLSQREVIDLQSNLDEVNKEHDLLLEQYDELEEECADIEMKRQEYFWENRNLKERTIKLEESLRREKCSHDTQQENFRRELEASRRTIAALHEVQDMDHSFIQTELMLCAPSIERPDVALEKIEDMNTRIQSDSPRLSNAEALDSLLSFKRVILPSSVGPSKVMKNRMLYSHGRAVSEAFHELLGTIRAPNFQAPELRYVSGSITEGSTSNRRDKKGLEVMAIMEATSEEPQVGRLSKENKELSENTSMRRVRPKQDIALDPHRNSLGAPPLTLPDHDIEQPAVPMGRCPCKQSPPCSLCTASMQNIMGLRSRTHEKFARKFLKKKMEK
ncbi:hypothetical protein CC80DRAFT_564776 [Byssothecium circinans]|uniref:Uncharacterized protein n=1 Tax=Byssothecium circinans TaxID=147558 RepID=A0A6A5TQT7_9PLEO|nr:hypothetical protein CC80DRAFT_564776 [Byssothecium circinans]